MAATALYRDGNNVKAQRYSTDGTTDGGPVTLTPRPAHTFNDGRNPPITYDEVVDSTIGPDGAVYIILASHARNPPVGVAVNSQGQFLFTTSNEDLLAMPGIPTPAANPTHWAPTSTT